MRHDVWVGQEPKWSGELLHGVGSGSLEAHLDDVLVVSLAVLDRGDAIVANVLDRVGVNSVVLVIAFAFDS
jgi:hypothetical protein